MTIDEFIAEQPKVLEAVLAEVPRQITALGPLRPAGPVILVGTWTSMNALVGVETLLARVVPAGVRVRSPLAYLAETEMGGGQGDLTVLLSQSGTSTTMLEAVARAQARGGRVLTLTSERGSPIDRAASEMVVMPVGPEPVGPNTKGYTASLLSLILLARATADFAGWVPRALPSSWLPQPGSTTWRPRARRSSPTLASRAGSSTVPAVRRAPATLRCRGPRRIGPPSGTSSQCHRTVSTTRLRAGEVPRPAPGADALSEPLPPAPHQDRGRRMTVQLGVDVGGTAVKLGLVTAEGAVTARAAVPFNPAQDFEGRPVPCVRLRRGCSAIGNRKPSGSRHPGTPIPQPGP